jgi:hypothetical protein
MMCTTPFERPPGNGYPHPGVLAQVVMSAMYYPWSTLCQPRRSELSRAAWEPGCGGITSLRMDGYRGLRVQNPRHPFGRAAYILALPPSRATVGRGRILVGGFSSGCRVRLGSPASA